eukprot:114430-Hanusia_phi.AAC.1
MRGSDSRRCSSIASATSALPWTTPRCWLLSCPWPVASPGRQRLPTSRSGRQSCRRSRWSGGGRAAAPSRCRHAQRRQQQQT